jgi:hypothetical protein
MKHLLTVLTCTNFSKCLRKRVFFSFSNSHTRMLPNFTSVFKILLLRNLSETEDQHLEKHEVQFPARSFRCGRQPFHASEKEKALIHILQYSVTTVGHISPHSWTILEGENPRILQKIRSPVFQCSRVNDVGRTLVVFPNKSEAFKLTMNAGY